MKNLAVVTAAFMLIYCSACVQKTYDKTVVYTLKTEGTAGITAVGIRGNDQPLSWETDYPLEVIRQDTLYRATVTYKTGYNFTEVKFTVNGEFELQNSPNRRIDLSSADTTYYEATFSNPN